jgi:predicted MFS family arabinose efflux permease
VVPQLVIPMAAGLVADDRRGAVTGLLLSGLVAGILLARAFGGLVGAGLGWRAPYLLAAGLMWVLAALLLRVLPRTEPSTREHYGRLVAGPLRLLGTEPELRRSCLYQAMLFAGFSAAWTALALLIAGPRYGLGTPVLGALGVVGAASVLATPFAGRAADRRGPDPVTLVCLVLALASAPVLLTGSLGGFGGLVGLAAGLVLLDVALQSSQVANQARIFALHDGARSRLNTAYMTCSFVGGSAGSWLGVQAYLRAGWGGVCALLALVAVTALSWHLAGLPARRRAAARSFPVAADATNPTA